MTDEKTLSPPYIGYGSFQSFISGLKENPLPDRIDRSVFGNMSGGLAYGLLSALKFLGLISANGTPDPLLHRMVEAADDQATQAALRATLERSYPGLFNGMVKLDRATSAQLDEYLRTSFGIQGGTIDKAASFVIAAATAAGLGLSAQLKSRKPIGSGNGNRRTKQKKSAPKDTATPSETAERQVFEHAKAETPNPVQVLVDIIDMSLMTDEEQEAVWTLIRFLKKQESQKKVMEETE